MLIAVAFEILVNALKALEAKANTWRRAFFASIPLFVTAKVSWLLIGAPTLIVLGFHLHHIYYGIMMFLYSVFSKFFKKYAIFNYKLLLIFSSIIVLDGVAAIF